MRLGLLFLALVPLIGASCCKLIPVEPSAEIPRLGNEACNIQSTVQGIENLAENMTNEITELQVSLQGTDLCDFKMCSLINTNTHTQASILFHDYFNKKAHKAPPTRR